MTDENMTDLRSRFLGTMYGLAYGDAISFPALFHRFQSSGIPRRRHNFLWRENGDLDNKHITRLMLPFTHRMAASNLEPSPTDDTEFALLSLKALLNEPESPSQATFVRIWKDEVLPHADEVRSSFSERSAIENFKMGLCPPATGNDNPLHYEDSAVARAVPIGLFCAGSPEKAAELAALDAQITQAEDGIYAAQGMAAAIAVLAGGGPLTEALDQARAQFPADSWIAHGDSQAQAALAQAETPQDMALLLSKSVINTVYSYGSAAPETFPAALAIVEACDGDLQTACSVANAIAKSADSIPAMVGALCGCYQGVDVISPMWRDALSTCRGLCLPSLEGANLDDLTLALLSHVTA